MRIIDLVKQWVGGGRKQFDEAFDAAYATRFGSGDINHAIKERDRDTAWQIFQLQAEMEQLKDELKKAADAAKKAKE